MSSCRIERVDQNQVILIYEGRTYSVPRGIFAETPVPGAEVSITAQAQNTSRVSVPTAHALLNALLSPSHESSPS